MKFKYLLLAVGCMLIAGDTYAQYANDALRFSQTQYGSTARFKAIGNAQTAVGGDLSSLGGNPAGLGLFTKSEFSLTPKFSNFDTKSSYLGTNTNTSRDRMNIGQAGVVWVGRISKAKGADLSKGLLSFNFGIGYNNTNDFGNKIMYRGTNSSSSIADYYADISNNAGYGAPSSTNPPSGTLSSAAYEGYLIDYVDGQYTPSTYADATTPNNQLKSINRTGGQSEVNFAAGLNISNKVYFGISLSVLDLNYTSTEIFNETGSVFGYPTLETDGFYNTDLRQTYNTNGSGFNGRLGIIVRPTDNFRIGANIQTPSWYSIKDSYAESARTRLGTTATNVTDDVSINPDIYDFSYNLRTPARYNIGMALFGNKLGFISGEIEYVDYSSIKFNSKYSEDEAVIMDNNEDVTNSFKSAVNFKIGVEVKVLPQVSLRAGYNLLGNPSQNSEDSRFKTNIYSAGAGYRINNFYLDLTYQNISYDTEALPYVLNNGNSPLSTTKNTANNVFLTVGARF